MSRKDVPDEMVVRAYAEWRQADRWPYELLADWTGQPEKVCYRACERAEARGLIEYGTSLRSGWLTDAGRQLLRSEQGTTPGPRGEGEPGVV